MIIILMFGSAIALFASVMFINQRVTRIIGTIIFGILFIVSTTLMTLNYSHHLGMEKVTTTTTQTVYSATEKLPIALYQPVGTNGQDNVLIYKTSQGQKKPVHTQANEYTTSKMEFTNRAKPQLKTTETRWRFKNNFYKCLFMWSGMNGTLVKRINVIKYPRIFIKLTPMQAQQLQKRFVAAGPRLQAQAKSFVTAKVQAAMAKQPHMSAQQIQQVSQQAEQEFMAQMIKQK
ncbi:DUF4811 domain-containing protein [Limosilactobacillus fastidiosus]|uniref:DUF4811 domain-containing protein n=1 Tax=Limosilactobacillus fastidiosus TaxID=2759855 RepID=A0A7W3TZ23_9LACO|nr:DUF4811 domain-containing protein [Limosilactobacillus fastidiosus]MBB1063370.1 DUF4811 domain-containing protein [Limosilactobacillus fastidiosus]MBB1085946.1 DUF4811 domain-containing protein [Limosilactobacillus fastidiosus]MCD7084639.1 DUF4811 domain-containing protein [Limosilactobacillus fastidiosus]MCD7085717.1 DUF4811 domain-containing protein [Limosilactobacillus fastidiosus]MCD7113794.1 DUF4811 domain-containing protein [Limosilactobacillus fastidiosus]